MAECLRQVSSFSPSLYCTLLSIYLPCPLLTVSPLLPPQVPSRGQTVPSPHSRREIRHTESLRYHLLLVSFFYLCFVFVVVYFFVLLSLAITDISLSFFFVLSYFFLFSFFISLDRCFFLLVLATRLINRKLGSYCKCERYTKYKIDKNKNKNIQHKIYKNIKRIVKKKNNHVRMVSCILIFIQVSFFI